MSANTSTTLSDRQVTARRLHSRACEVARELSDLLGELRAFRLELDAEDGSRPLHHAISAVEAVASIEEELEGSTEWVVKHMPDELLQLSELVDLADR